MERFDAVGGDFQRGQRFGGDRRLGFGDFVRADAQVFRREWKSIEALCVIEQRSITAQLYFGDDGRDRGRNVSPGLAHVREQVREGFREVGLGGVERSRHG